MKRINQYRKLFSVESKIDLKELKKTYRSLVKEWHPDKFQAEDPKAKEAELISKDVIDGYHFLVSIAPETKESQLDEYNESITSGIDDFTHKGLLMEVKFKDGNVYEFFGVNGKLFQKLINSDKQMRFAKRSIFNSFIYRKSKKASLEVA